MSSPKLLRIASRSVMAAAVAIGIGAAPATGLAQTRGPESVSDIAETLVDAVVNISTTQNALRGGGRVPMPQIPDGSPFEDYFQEFFNDGGRHPQLPGPGSSLGSGFVIDAGEGIVVTNNHVITGADEIVVNFADGATRTAEIVGIDSKTDLAVLKIDPAGKNLSQVPFGDSDAMRIGDWVMAIGNPFGFGGSLTVGIVSARNRQIGAGPYEDYIQTDAAINRGNSGGPLFNMEGEVIGINTAIISPTGGSIGIGFAIPSNLATNVIDQLREFGETRRGWLGVRIQEVTEEVAESLGLGEAAGVLISGIEKNGPAEGGALQAGDIIVGFGGLPIAEVRELRRIVAESPVGKTVEVEILRKGERQTVQVTLGRLEEAEISASAEDALEDDDAEEETGPVSSAKVFGMTIVELDEEGRGRFDVPEDISGVLISEVEDGSVAAEQGVQAGDVIVEIALESVSEPEDVLTRIDDLRAEGRKNALLMLAGASGELRFVTLRMN
ncbi:Do family serine endopeptidase [Chelativorans sp. M5D2P16]|uniref:Do family serine endopeptidase n=1 Tax=Chelativorans sp. M5D2P16 TaxID=3095678 RepID=UPI002ACA762C|nr:Do family serine endopeptidase [Chelativorans sp. M5D2P16]MDZ5698206.1 Do family serine endopeptidase [Chelativorans sp. M5D2P16]